MKKRNTGSAFFARVSRALSLFLFLLLLCGTASAELVYSVASKDFSLEQVTYDATGAPQTGTLVEGIKASGVELPGTFSTSQGEWRVLTDISSRDITATSDPVYVAAVAPIYVTAIDTHSYSLYGLDKAQKAPLATSQKLAKSWYSNDSHLTSSALYVLSQDTSSSPYSSSASREILKLSLDTLEVSKTKAVKGYPQWNCLEDRGVIYYFDNSSSTPSLVFLDADLKDTTVVLDGNYSYNGSLTDLDDTSFALSFTSRDVQTWKPTDLGIFKISGSKQSVIVKAEDVGFEKDTDSWSVNKMVKDRKGGLYFNVYSFNYNTGVESNDVYHWDGSATTSIYEAKAGESVSLLNSDSAGNLYFSTSKNDSETSKSTYTLYRCGASDAKATELKSVNDGSWFDLPSSISDADFYFSAIKYNDGIYSYTYFHYNGTEAKEIHAFKDVAGAVSLPKDDMKHKTLYLYSLSQDVTAGSTTSTVVAFNNTDRHNPVKLKEFSVAGKISDVALYNYKVSESSGPESSKSTIPTRKPTKAEYNSVTTPEVDLTKTPASGWTSIPITIERTLPDGTKVKPKVGTIIYIWVEFISSLSVAADDNRQPDYKVECEEEGKIDLAPSKWKNLDGTPVTNFPGGVYNIAYQSEDVDYVDDPIKAFKGGIDGVALASLSTTDPTSSKGSGGCDAGFGALALALAAVALLKRGK